MDAYKSENISSDVKIESQETSEMESSLFAEEGASSLEMFLEQEESQQPQTLEAEFADYTQQAAASDLGSLDEFLIASEADSEVAMDSELASVQMSHGLESLDSDEHQFDLNLEETTPEAGDLEPESDLSLNLDGVLNESAPSDETVSLNLEIASEPEVMLDLTGEPNIGADTSLDALEGGVAQDIETLAEAEDQTESDLALDLGGISERELSPEMKAESEVIGAVEEPQNEELTSESFMTSTDELELEVGSDLEGILEVSESSLVEQSAELESAAESDITPDQEEEESASASVEAPEAESEVLQKVIDEQQQTIADLQGTITLLEQDVTDWKIQADAKIDPTEFDGLQTQSKEQGALITKLEAEVETLKANYAQSQLAAEQKIEPELYQSIQTEVQQLTAQVRDWETRYEELSQKFEQQLQLVNNLVDPEVHASLNQEVQAYKTQVQTLQSEKEDLEKSVQHWQSQAEDKIDRMEYEAVLEQLQRLKEKNARSLWTRIMDWIKGN